MNTTPQAALLSDKEINARISGSEVHEYEPGAILEFVRQLEQDILSKLKPPPSILTNNELIDLAVEHGLGRKMPPLGLNTGNVFYTDNSYRTAALFDFADAHEAAIFAKLQATQEPGQAGWAQSGSGDTLARPGSIIGAPAEINPEITQNKQEPVQAGELPDEREAFEAYMSDNGKWPAAVQRYDNGARGYVLLQTSTAWGIWQARAALSARKPTDAWQDVSACPDGDVWFSLSCGHVVMGYKHGAIFDWEANIDHDCCGGATATKAMPVTPPDSYGIGLEVKP